jgi:PAS domain S-box-containing protein
MNETEQKPSGDYYALFEQATDPILVTDFKGNFKDVNSSFCNLFGYTKEELLQSNIRTLLDKQHLEEKPIRFDLLSNGENIFNERKMLHKSGAVVYVEANSKRFKDNHILVIARNITERKKAELVLKQSEANLHTIFDTTDTIYVLFDISLNIISCNRPSADILENIPDLQNKMATVLTGKHIKYEMSYPGKDGATNWHFVRILPISKGDHNIYGLMIAASDITEKKLLEQELFNQQVDEQRKITRAVADAQEKERAGIGEELHDNVNQLLASSKLFLNHYLSFPGDCNTSYILKSRDYISTAMNEIRKISHALVGPAQDKKTGLIDSLKELISDILLVKEIKIAFNCPDYCEHEMEAGLNLVVYRIIQEQLNNILKYAKASSVKITLKKEGAQLIIIVYDNGRGFDTSAKRKGIGLKNIINRAEIYNGKVDIDSSPGNGCKMTIVFPL